jgi:hypothetical protein
MTRSKLSTKVAVLAAGIGLSMAAFAGSQPAAAQSYSYTCPDDFTYDPTYGCVTSGGDDYGYYGYPTVLRGHPDHRGFDHGIGADVAHLGRGGFAHAMGVAHVGGLGHMSGGFGGFHGGFGHGGGVGHR